MASSLGIIALKSNVQLVKIGRAAMRPVLQAILLAERVYEDKSGKKIIAGTFNRLFINRKGKIPEDHPTDSTKKLLKGGGDIGSPYVYVSLTDLVPEVEITLKVINVSKNEVVLEWGPVKVICPDRLATVELVLPLPPPTMYMTEAGTYSLDLIWKDELLGSHRVTVEDVTDKQKGA